MKFVINSYMCVFIYVYMYMFKLFHELPLNLAVYSVTSLLILKTQLVLLVERCMLMLMISTSTQSPTIGKVLASVSMICFNARGIKC